MKDEKSIDGKVLLLPGHLYLAASIERFQVPADVICLVFSKSTYARVGLISFATPFEPKWDGTPTLEFAVTLPVLVVEGAGIAQIIFLNGEPTTAPYTGKYQNQAAEAVGAMVGHDEIVVDWGRVPEGYDWVAVDHNENGYAYTKEPFIETSISRHLWSCNVNCDYKLLSKDVFCLPPSFDWTQTLRRRPQ